MNKRNEKIQSALDAYETRKNNVQTTEGKISKALQLRDNYNIVNLEKTISELKDGINKEMVAYRTLQNPFGEDAFKKAKARVSDGLGNITKLKSVAEAYRKYLGEETTNALLTNIDVLKKHNDLYSEHLEKNRDLYTSFDDQYDYYAYVLNNTATYENGMSNDMIAARMEAYNALVARFGELERLLKARDEAKKVNTGRPIFDTIANFTADAATEEDIAISKEMQKLNEQIVLYERFNKGNDVVFSKNYNDEKFLENCKYIPRESKNSDAVFYPDEYRTFLEYYNIGPDLSVHIPLVQSGKELIDYSNTAQSKGWNYATKSEFDMLNYIANTKGDGEAQKYFENLSKELTYRRSIAKEAQWNEKYNQSSFLGKIGLNIASVPQKLFGNLSSGMLMLEDIIVGNKYDPYAAYHDLRKKGDNTRKNIEIEIEKLTDGANVLGFTVGDVYQAAMSGVDSLAGAVTFGKGYSAIMAVGAASTKAEELYKQGATNEQIAIASFSAGVSEMVFETISIDYFLKNVLNAPTKTVKQWFVKSLASGGVEMSEEMLTEISNIYTDAIVLGSRSEWSQTIDKYKQKGYSDSDAIINALWDIGGDVLKAGFSGFISGEFIGGGVSFINYASNKTAEKYNAVLTYGTSLNSVNALVENGLAMPEGSAAYKLATKASTQLNSGKNLSGTTLYNLANAIQGEIESKSSARLSEFGVDNKTTKALSPIVAKAVFGENLTQQEQETLNGNVTAVQVVKELSADRTNTIWKDTIKNSNINNDTARNDAVTDKGEVLQSSADSVVDSDSADEVGSVQNSSDTAAPGVVEGYDGKQYFDDGSGDEYFGDSEGADVAHGGDTSAQGEAFDSGSFDLAEPTPKDIARAPSAEEAIEEAITGKQKTNIQRHIVDICKKLDSNVTVEFVDKLEGNGKFIRSQNKILIRSELNAVQMYVEVFKHEFMHRLETKQLYSKFFDFCFKKSKAFEQYVRAELKSAGVEQNVDLSSRDSVLEAYTKYKFNQYKNAEGIPKIDRDKFTMENAREEIVADFFAQILFQGKQYRARIIEALQNADGEGLIGIGDEVSSEAALMELQQKEPTLFEQVVEWFKDIINKLRGLPQAKSLVEQLDNEINLLESMARRAYQSKDSKRLMKKKLADEKHSAVKEKSNIITIDMSERQRYEILKDKKIQPQEIEIDKNFDIEHLEKNIKSIVEKPLIKKIKELGYLRKYQTNTIDVDFELTVGGVRKSLNSQVSHYGGNIGDFAKVIMNLQKLLDNSVLLDVHSDKAKGSIKENARLKQTYVLMSAFNDGNSIKPVQFEIKQYIDNDNRLYLAVALTKIETGVVGNTATQNELRTTLVPISNISLAELFAKINPKDRNILKYIPNEFLNKKQLEAKEVALKEESKKYGKFVESSDDVLSGQYSLGSPLQKMRYNPEAYAKHLNRKYQSKADSDTIAKKIKQIVAQDNKSAKKQEDTRQKVYDREGNLVGELTLKERLINELAVEIAESIPAPRLAYADEVLSLIKEKPLRVSDKQEAEIKSQYGTLTNFRKDTGIRLSNPKDPQLKASLTPLEVAWNGSWVSEYPGEFKSDINDLDMPIRLAEIVDKLNGMTEEIDVQAVAAEVADNLTKTLNETGPKAEKRRVNEAYRRGVVDERAKNKKQISELQKQNRNLKNRVKPKDVQNIRKEVERIYKKLAANSSTKHVHQDLKKAVSEFLEIFRQNDEIAFKPADREKVTRLWREYQKLAETDSTSEAFGYDAQIALDIELLEEILPGRSMWDLHPDELTQIKDIIANVSHCIEKVNTMVIDGKTEEIAELSGRAMVELRKQKGKIVDFGNFDLDIKNTTPVYFFERTGSKVLQKIFADIKQGENTWAQNMLAAREKIAEIKKRYGYDKWKDVSFKFTTKLGDDIELDLEQAMLLYATVKRERANLSQEAEHTYIGGVVIPTKKVKSLMNQIRGFTKADGESESSAKKRYEGLVDSLRKQIDVAPHQIRVSDFAKISNFLTEQQKAYADEMVAFLSNDMAKLGNAVSMKLFGIEKFNEKYYIPYNSADNFIASMPGVEPTSSIKHRSFTKDLTHGANNPLMLTSFSEVCANHIEQMCMYNAMAIPVDNLTRVLNATIPGTDGTAPTSVKNEIERTMGKSGLKYINNLIRDMSGSVHVSDMDSLVGKLTGRYKKVAVLASLSVIIQQPTSVVRAFRYIPPKYFLKTSLKTAERNYEQMKRYVGEAIIKEMGGFDTGVGATNSEYLLQPKRTAGQVIDDVAGWGANKADQITWAHIWAASKAMVAKQNPELQVGSEAFFKKAAEICSETLSKTQVYDSILVKSEAMRSKSALSKMATAFMSEPTVTYNMMASAMRDAAAHKKGAIKALVNTSAVIIGQIVVNAAFKSLVYAMRDDDEDETYFEKWLASFVESAASDMNYFNYLPFTKDIVSLMQGYSVERMDVAAMADIKKAFEKAFDEKASGLDRFKSMCTAFSLITGVPVKNIWRDAEGAYKTIKQALEKEYINTPEGTKKAALIGLAEAVDWIPGIEVDVDGSARIVSELEGNATYDSLDDDDKEKVENNVSSYLKKSEKFEKGELRKKSEQFEDLYEIRRKYGSSSKKYRTERKKMLDSGIEEKDLELGLEIAKFKYLEANGITVAEYYAAKAELNRKDDDELVYDTDESGGLNAKEKEKAIKGMDGFSSAEKKFLKEIL